MYWMKKADQSQTYLGRGDTFKTVCSITLVSDSLVPEEVKVPEHIQRYITKKISP